MERSLARPGGDLRRWPRDRFNYDTVHTYSPGCGSKGDVELGSPEAADVHRDATLGVADFGHG